MKYTLRMVSCGAPALALLLVACSGADGAAVVPADAGMDSGVQRFDSGSSRGGSGEKPGTDAGEGGKAGGGGAGGAADSGGSTPDAGSVDASDASTTPGVDASDATTALDAGQPGCPTFGNYALRHSGSGCGDLDDTAPSQRLDVFNCTGSVEFDSGGTLGVAASGVTFQADGVLPARAFTVGSATMTCSGTTTSTHLALACAGEAGVCTIELTQIP